MDGGWVVCGQKLGQVVAQLELCFLIYDLVDSKCIKLIFLSYNISAFDLVVLILHYIIGINPHIFFG